MGVQQLEGAKASVGGFVLPEQQNRAASPRVVLEEVLEMLEDYAPTWYTEELHNRIVAAIMSNKR